MTAAPIQLGMPNASTLLLVDRCGVIQDVLPGSARMLPVDGFGSRVALLDLIIANDRDAARASLQSVGDGFTVRETVRVRMEDQAGELRLVDILITDANGHLATESLLVTCTDVTSRNDTTDALRSISRQIAMAPIDDTNKVLDQVLQRVLEVAGLHSVAVFHGDDQELLGMTGAHRRRNDPPSPEGEAPGDTADPARSDDLKITLSRLVTDGPQPATFPVGPLRTEWKVVIETLTSDSPLAVDRAFDPVSWDALFLPDLPPFSQVVFVPLVAREGIEGIMSFGCRTADWQLSTAVRDFLMTVAELIAGSLARRRSALALRYRAQRDALTGLANRRTLIDRLDDALVRSRRNGSWVSLLFIDCDGFKDVNDRHGHDVGDALLIAIADRLQQVCRGGETVARFGGDEFVVMVESDLPEAAVDALGERIVENVSGSYVCDGTPVPVTVSVGVAVHHGDDEPIDATAMFRRADLAMYRSKRLGKNRAELFTEEMEAHTRDRFELVSDLRSAVRVSDELVLWYQPIFNLMEDRLSGYEALVRWNHPTRGLLFPGSFIELAEESGLIADLGWLVLDLALRDFSSWREQGWVRQDATIAINLSVRQIIADDFYSLVSKRMELAGVPPELIELEVTESVFADRTTVVPRLTKLRDLGVKLSIDDFGTGYSSLSYLRDLPVDILKIDRSFVEGLGASARDDALVGTLITLSKQLSLDTIAEGVEQDRQLATLAELGCTRAQGYLLGRPQPGADLHQTAAALQVF